MIKKLIKICSFPAELWLALISYLPGRVGVQLRYYFWKKRLRYLGKNVRIDTGVYFQNPNYISINDNCWIDKNVMILAGLDKSRREKVVIKNSEFNGEKGVVYLGKNIHLGPGCIISGISAGVYISDECGFSANCRIYAFSHHYKSKNNPGNTNICFSPLVSPDRQCLREGAIFIGANTGVALNSVILPGVSMPSNCFITINSVVYPKKYQNNSIIAGNPAREIGRRFKRNE